MTYIIAEAGVAHEGSLSKAKALLNIAVAAGADAFKTQHWKGELRGPNRILPRLRNSHLLELQCECIYRGLDFLCTPHDEWAIDFMESEKLVGKYKIGSGGWHLIDKALMTKKPLIVSAGMHGNEAVMQLDSKLRYQSDDCTILHCISEYPTPPIESGLRYLQKLMTTMRCRVGYSDHTQGIAIPIAAASFGATIIEKHIRIEAETRDKQDSLVAASLEELTLMCSMIRDIDEALSVEHSDRRITQGERETAEWLRKREVAHLTSQDE